MPAYSCKLGENKESRSVWSGKGVSVSQKNEWCMSLFYGEGKCVEQQISTVTPIYDVTPVSGRQRLRY